jgi:AbrB family looped-hinge helix DNA binding protein
MATTTVSEKFEITIPEKIRSKLNIRPGQQIELAQIGNRIELVPVRNINNARGFLKGIRTTTIKRESDRL